jgi:hypothetical protein
MQRHAGGMALGSPISPERSWPIFRRQRKQRSSQVFVLQGYFFKKAFVFSPRGKQRALDDE